MKLFNNYLDPSITLIERMGNAFDYLGLDIQKRNVINVFLEPLHLKDEMTWEHSIRVGLLCEKIASFMHLDSKALFYPGILHDIGKALTDPQTLKKVEAFQPKDYREIMNHVKDGYRLLRGYFDFTAEVMWWHHRFQPNKYPKNLPKNLHEYSEGTKIIIPLYGRLLSLADSYDALHRINKKFETETSLTGEQIKEKMINFNPDQKILIDELYKADIFTTTIFK